MKNKLSALVVDDERFMREMVKVQLEAMGFSVVVAENGQKAMEEIEMGLSPDLAVVDMLMPEQEGIETIIALKKKSSPPKIIAMSGGGSMRAEELLSYAGKLGADVIMVKPLDLDSFEEKIRSFF